MATKKNTKPRAMGKTAMVVNVADQKVPQQAQAYKIIEQKQVVRVRQDIKKWRDAIVAAERISNPKREQLHQTYLDILLDAHLSSMIQSRKLKTLAKPFLIVDDGTGEADPEASKLFTSEWFNKFIELALDSRFWGFTLIQLGDIVADGYAFVDLVHRDHVKPELGIVVAKPADDKGVPFLEPPFNDWTVAVGETHDLGLLCKAAPIAIYKKAALGAWSEYLELFGMPTRIGRTQVRDEVLRSNMEKMLKNMGSASWGVFDEDDKIELVQASGSIGNPVYESMIKLCDEQTSKLIFGQTMTADNGSSRSQAEVHQNTANEYAAADQRLIESVVNGQLIPLMIRRGFPLAGKKFKYDQGESFSLQQKFDNLISLVNTGKYSVKPETITKEFGIEVEAVEAPDPAHPSPSSTDVFATLQGMYNKVKNFYE